MHPHEHSCVALHLSAAKHLHSSHCGWEPGGWESQSLGSSGSFCELYQSKASLLVLYPHSRIYQIPSGPMIPFLPLCKPQHHLRSCVYATFSTICKCRQEGQGLRLLNISHIFGYNALDSKCSINTINLSRIPDWYGSWNEPFHLPLKIRSQGRFNIN